MEISRTAFKGCATTQEANMTCSLKLALQLEVVRLLQEKQKNFEHLRQTLYRHAKPCAPMMARNRTKRLANIRGIRQYLNQLNALAGQLLDGKHKKLASTAKGFVREAENENVKAIFSFLRIHTLSLLLIHLTKEFILCCFFVPVIIKRYGHN